MTAERHDIKLSEWELEEIKDDVAFKTKTTLTLKHVLNKLDELNGVRDEVTSLQTHRSIHWFLISVIITGLIGLAFAIFKG